MRTRSLGTGGPDVSVVGLGCNNFGSRVDEQGTRAVVDAALEVGITLFDTADVYGNRGGSEDLLGKALEGRRDRVVLATKFGHAMTDDAPPNRGSREYVRTAIDASPEAPPHRRDRPVPVPPARRGDADRGDDRRDERARRRGQGALHRLVELRARADRAGGRVRALELVASARQRPERVLAARARRRAGAAAGLRAARDRRAPVLPARERPAHRQVPPRRARPGRHPSRDAARASHRRGLRRARGARGVREGARPHAARARVRGTARPARGLVSDRRSDKARAGARERRCGRVGARRAGRAGASRPNAGSRSA